MFRILLIIVLIYLIYQWVLKPILGILMQYTLRKFIDEQMKKGQGRPYAEQQRSKPEGSINIDYIPKDRKSQNKDKSDEGEYVDYEEVK